MSLEVMKGVLDQHVNIKILDDESFYSKLSAMTNQRKAGLINNS